MNLSSQVVVLVEDYKNDWYKYLVAYPKLGKFPIIMYVGPSRCTKRGRGE